MVWLILALLTAFFESMKDVFSKKSLKNIDEYAVAWALRFFALPFVLPLLLFIEIPKLGSSFWMALFVSGTLNLITTLLYMKAIKLSDLSITVPMVTFTPLFLLATSPLIVNEFPNVFGIIGIALIVAGSYVLNISKKQSGYFAPFKALLREKGPRLMLGVAFLWSITANFDKVGILNSSPLFWVVSINVFIALLLTPLMLYKSKVKLSNVRALVPVGLFSGLTHITQMSALSLTLVAYVISIKRTSTIMSVLWGYLIFKEKGIKERLAGTAIMVVGVLFIALS
jgi:uncharacterized membrane protein